MQVFANSRLTAIDLFAGCGGLTLGLRNAGFHVVGAVEIDKRAAATYKENHKRTLLLDKDIRDIDPINFLKVAGLKIGELSLLAGCPPCQGFSRLRTNNGASSNRDQRNNLINEFTRFVKAMLPQTLMLENVPQLNGTAAFYKFRKDIRALGYTDKTDVLNVADYGVPQRRKRLIYMASRIGSVMLAVPLQNKVTVRDCIGGLLAVGQSGDPIHDLPEYRSDKVKAIISALPKDGGSRSALPPELRLDCHKKTSGFRDVYGRMSWDSVAPTITSGCTNPSKGRFVHPSENRAISLREAAMLQGFPKNYKFIVSHGKSSIALMIGNALPPPFIHKHASALKDHIREAKPTS